MDDEEEDIMPGDMETNLDEIGPDEQEVDAPAIPNNDFCFTESDFMTEKASNNTSLRHIENHRKAWIKIEELEGQIVEMGSGPDKIIWKVVRGSFKDDVTKSLKQHQESFDAAKLDITTDGEPPLSFLDCFSQLWSDDDFATDMNKLNATITKTNLSRKKNYQKPLKLVGKS